MSGFESSEKPCFDVHPPFRGVFTVSLNQAMRDLLAEVLQDIEPEEEGGHALEAPVWAFMRALKDPHGCRRLRDQRREERRDSQFVTV